jgi:small subunit ribosomal protein S2
VADVSIAELLEAGVHFGHQTRRWNPKMRRFIYGERGGIYIIDLLKTSALLAQAQEFASTIAHRGGTVLFVGTKKQARDTVRDVAQAAGMPYVNHRWLGGLLTNFETISQRIRRLHDLERFEAEGQLELLPTRERMAAQADLAKLRANLGGVKDMQRVPDAMFVIDLKTEVIAVKEAQRLRIPIMGLVDTNCDPDGIDFVIPGNDDAIRSCALITQAIGQVVAEGHSVFRAEEERARQEAEERARIEAEARAKREAEEQAKREAEEQAKREAEEQAAREAAARAAAAAPAEQPAVSEPAAQPAPVAQPEPVAQPAPVAQPGPVPAAAPAPTEAEAPVAAGAAAVAQAPTETVAATPSAGEETPQPSEAPAPATPEVAETAEEPPAEQPKAEEPPAAEQKAEESAPAQEPNAEQSATAEEPTNGAEPAAAESSEASDVDGSPQATESETVEQTTETGAK